MIRGIVILLLLGAAAWFVRDLAASNPLRPEVRDREVVVRTQDLEVHYDRQGADKQTYMVFGGTKAERSNSMSNVTLATISIERAAALRRAYPDFTKCASPGAKRAQRAVMTTNFVAIDGAARKVLRKAVDLHKRSVANGGDRICVAVEGEHLSLSSIKLASSGFDLTPPRRRRGQKKASYFLARKVELPECAVALGN